MAMTIGRIHHMQLSVRLRSCICRVRLCIWPSRVILDEPVQIAQILAEACETGMSRSSEAACSPKPGDLECDEDDKDNGLCCVCNEELGDGDL